MNIGDVVEVRGIRQFQGDSWRSARVVAMDPNKFHVVLLAGDFADRGMPGINQVALAYSDKERTWR